VPKKMKERELLAGTTMSPAEQNGRLSHKKKRRRKKGEQGGVRPGTIVGDGN